jgi:hypothetical protein
MTEQLRSFLHAFGEALCAGVLPRSSVASWLAPEQIQRQWQTWQDRVAAGWGIEPRVPDGVRVDLRSTTIDRLRDDFEDIPSDLTAANFRGWGRITVLADEDAEFEAWADVWVAVVDEAGRLGVGYAVFGPAD